MKDFISHEGQVTGTIGDNYKITILSQAACGGCRAKGYCGGGETAIKEITAHSDEKLQVGDLVTIFMKQKRGLQAVFWAYLLPLFFMIATASIFNIYYHNDNLTAISALGVLLLYYLFLYLFNKKISGNFNFIAKKNN